jgi:hypothetical protein
MYALDTDEFPLIQSLMNDYKCIFNIHDGNKSYNVSPNDIAQIHKDHASWLYETILAALDCEIVIVTNHLDRLV